MVQLIPFAERCPSSQKSRVERLKAKVEPLLSNSGIRGQVFSEGEQVLRALRGGPGGQGERPRQNPINQGFESNREEVVMAPPLAQCSTLKRVFGL